MANPLVSYDHEPKRRGSKMRAVSSKAARKEHDTDFSPLSLGSANDSDTLHIYTKSDPVWLTRPPNENDDNFKPTLPNLLALIWHELASYQPNHLIWPDDFGSHFHFRFCRFHSSF